MLKRKQPQKKNAVSLQIPGQLAKGLSEALDEIEWLEGNEDYDIEGVCDAIQVEGLSGGKYGDSERPFVFSYYHDNGSEESRPWHIAMSLDEIESITSGQQTEIDLFTCIDPGCDFHTNDSNVLCDDCDYWEDPNFGNFEFPDATQILDHFGVNNVSKNTSIETICSILGEPTRSGGDKHTESLGYVYPWIVFEYENYNLHFQFTSDKTQIQLLTVQEPDWDKS